MKGNLMSDTIKDILADLKQHVKSTQYRGYWEILEEWADLLYDHLNRLEQREKIMRNALKRIDSSFGIDLGLPFERNLKAIVTDALSACDKLASDGEV